MKRIRVIGLGILFTILGIILGVSDTRPMMAGNGADDGLPTVEVFAARGVLKVHGQNETQYRDMAPGSQALSNGSYLKTVGGQANILFPDNSVICLDANTEVRVGIYAHGNLILQRSGTVGHSVEWRQGSNYCVDIPFGRAKATGTEFFTIIDTPFEGAVSVVAGTVLFQPHGLVVDPQTGNIEEGYWTKDLVTEGEAFTVYPHNQSLDQALKWGDYFKLSIDQLDNPPYVRGSKITHFTDSAWVQRNRNLLRMIEALRRARQRGRLSPDDYRQKLGALLGMGPQLVPREPIRWEGGLWTGIRMEDDRAMMVINFCAQGNQIDMVHVVAADFLCFDRQTHEQSRYSVNFSLGEGTPFLLERNGTFYGWYEFTENEIYYGLVFEIEGRLGGSSGQAMLSFYSTDKTPCELVPGIYTISLRLAPSPCVR